MPVKYSIIVPAYKEKGNLQPLTERVIHAMNEAGLNDCEMIIVDDNSNDGSEEVVEELKKKGFPVTIIVRKTERGLSSAVLRGFHEASGSYLLCMDADLQHPPEVVPRLFESLLSKSNEFTLGTRYAPGTAIDKDWPLYRRVISSGARMLARPLTPMSDPMSGFFALRKDVLSRGTDVSGVGFKIALELYVKCKVTRHSEVGFSFGCRTVGESKLTGKVIVQYLKHLHELYFFRFGFGLYAFVVLVALSVLRLFMILLA